MAIAEIMASSGRRDGRSSTMPLPLFCIIFSLILFLLPFPSAHAGEVTLKTGFAQPVMPEGEGGRVYLRVSLDGVASESEGRRIPANVVLVIDKSGSMLGGRIDQAKEAALMAVERLGDRDVLGVVAYSDEAFTLSPAARLRDTDAVRQDIRRLDADGRTALYAGVTQGIRELKPFVDPYAVNRIILLSDGLANIGPSSPKELEDLGREAARANITVTTIGLGLGYNEDLMTRLALASEGNHAFVEHPDDLVDIFNKEFGDVLSAIGSDVEIIIECPDGVRPMRALGREAKIEGQKVRLDMNKVYGKQQKYAVIELEVAKAAASGAAKAAIVEVTYTDMASKQKRSLEGKADIRFSRDSGEAKASVDGEVMASVTRQIATENNEKAVLLRDSGKVEEARKVLKENVDYLNRQADALPTAAAAPLRELSKKNETDAGNLTGQNWDRQRKSMRAQQYKDKTQQKY
jgi:Ca-activated chloride channel homolog